MATSNTDIKLENTFIAQLLSQPDATGYVKACSAWLSAEDFADDYNARCWTIAATMTAAGVAVNLVNFYASATKAGLNVDTKKLVSNTWAGDLLHMAATIHELATRRRLAGALSSALMGLDDPNVTTADAVAELDEALTEANRHSTRTLTSWRELYQRVLRILEAKAAGELPAGVPAGYRLIDDEGGLEEGALVIIAGRTSNGKTAFALNVALNAAIAGAVTVVYSLEMTNEQLGGRLLANLTGVSNTAIKNGQLNEQQWHNVTNTDDSLPLYFDDDRDGSKDALFRAIRNAVDTKGARVVFIDYLQLVKAAGRDRRVEVSEIANDLKVLAVQLKITVVLLSQLAREARGLQPVPRINELKESGEIENAADAVYMVYRPEQHSASLLYPDMSQEWSRYTTRNTALLICAKNRNGRMGEQLLNFDGNTSRFWEGSTFAAAEVKQDFNAF